MSAVPNLRFAEFNDTLKKVKLNDVANIKRGAGSQYIDYVNGCENGIRLIRIGDFLGSDPVYVVNSDAVQRFTLKSGDILIAGTGATAGIVFEIPDFFSGLAFSYNAPRIRPTGVDTKYFLNYLKTPSLETQKRRLFTGNAQPFLDTTDLRNLWFFLPSLAEQKKIADFLGAVDEKIRLLRALKDGLETFKKGVMQKIFTQTLRFKADDGSDFPDWEKKSADDIFKNHSNKDHLGDLPILAITQEHGAIARDSLDKEIQTTQASIDSYKVVERGDFIISLRSFQGGIEYSEVHGICSPAYTILKPILPISGGFYKQYMKMGDFIQRLSMTVVGIRDGKQISYSAFSTLKLHYPSLPEQQKIADFLSAIDDKITAVTAQIDRMQDFKKGLLQQMFV